MVRMSLVGGTTFYHAKYFSHMFNGCDPVQWEKHEFGGDPSGRRRIEEARVVKVGDEKRHDADTLAAVCKIDQVCDDIDPKGESYNPDKPWDADTFDAIASVVRERFGSPDDHRGA